MKTEDPERYSYFTASGTWGPEYYQMCREMAAAMEAAGERGRFLRTRLREQVLTIEWDVQSLSAGGGGLFDFERARLSERIREATDALVSLRGNIRDYSVTQIAEVDSGLKLLDGDAEAPDGDRDILFARWIMAVLDSEDGPKEARVQASSVVSTGTNTRMSRMAAGGRVLEADSRDVSVLVISENDFAVELHGVDNAPVVGAKVTVKDLNGNTVVTKPTEDPKAGSAVFNANEFTCDFDKEMELSLEVDASEQGYRSFCIPPADAQARRRVPPDADAADRAGDAGDPIRRDRGVVGLQALRLRLHLQRLRHIAPGQEHRHLQGQRRPDQL